MVTLKLRAAIAGATIFTALFMAVPAFAHDAIPTAAKPNGWAYPLACCSGYDCREVNHGQVQERPEGYVIQTTGEVIAMTDAKVRPSPDGEFHWCSVQGKNDGKTICLFVPPRGF